jgi:hypothetical protein
MPPVAAYSVLTHEQIVDLLWDEQMKPLLLEQYPGSSAEDLLKAHAYAYGGSLIQNMGYLPVREPVVQRPGSLRDWDYERSDTQHHKYNTDPKQLLHLDILIPQLL